MAVEMDTTSEKNAQGMLLEEEEDDEREYTSEENHLDESDKDVIPSKKRKETCVNNLIPETPTLQLQGQLFHVTVEEKDNSLVLDAEMPMLNMETLVMAVDDGHRILTISGEKVSPSRKRARVEKTANVLVEEINNTKFYRKVEIPQGYDINHASTTYKDGALTITFKKKVEKNAPRPHVITPRKRGMCVVQ
eukprot:Phypoly_transcript_21951.p1 GENE.Phypoly_transcript_21951~~Phypoly_transcript_21951.p1  ORF type:complete len:192 (+),score=43.04 Phypoly_transcript_21951:30-605(+)